MTDRELLAQYAANGSAQAFAEIVERHAGTVYGACLRVLGERQAAEDAAQATFLMLVRKARRLAPDTVVSGWLFLTARAVARNALRQERRRELREREAAEMQVQARSPEQDTYAEVRPHLDAALAALPTAQRDALVMRYLDGKPEAEIGRELGCGQSGVAMRLSRGLEKLRAILARQGAVVPAAALGGLLAGQGQAAVPVALMAALKGLGAGGAAASASAVALAEGTMKTMMIAKLKLAAAVVGATLVVGGGGGAVVAKLAAGEQTAPAPPLPETPVDKLKPGEWFEAPGSKLTASSVFPPKPTPPGNPGDVMLAWCGGALDTKRSQLVVHGGGHGNYAGNEIYTFDLVTFKWSRPWGPSKNSDIPAAKDSENKNTYLDGAPSSVHTYDGLVYLPGQDRLWRGGGALWSGSGGGTQSCWTFDFEKLAWQRRADSNCGCLGVSVCAEYDPVTGHIFATGDHYGFGEYDPEKDTWTARGDLHMGEDPTMAVDPEARLVVCVGNGMVGVYNIKTGKVSTQKTTGDQAVVKARGPGLVYDGKLRKIVGWAGGTSLYSLDTATWTWTEHKAAATNSVTPKISDAFLATRLLVFSRFQYWPAKDAYVVVTSVGDSVYFGKIAPASPPPAPAATAQPRNAKLKDIPANTWVKVGDKFGRDCGAAEVPWCYDPDGRRFVRVGGCSGTYSNEIWSYDLGADTFTCNLPYQRWADPAKPGTAPSDRPGKGCNRGVCYDRDNKCIWSWGGATSDGGPGNTFGLWKGTGKLGAGDWQHFEVPTIEQGMIAYDEAAKRLVCTSQHWVALGAGTFQTMVVDPATGKAETLKARIDSPELVAAARAKVEAKTWGSGKPAEFQSLVYVPDLGGVLFTTSFPWNWGETRKDPEAAMVAWVYSLKENAWKDLKPKASPPWRSSHSTSYDSKNHVVLLHGGVTAIGAPQGEHHRALNDTWVYLPKENTWVEMKPKDSPYAQDGAMLMAYDPEHDVHVVGKYFGHRAGSVWVYRYAPPAGRVAGPGN